MAIYNKRTNFDLKQWTAHFQKRNSVLNILYSIIRFLVIIVENLYCIPSYLVLSWLVLLPTSWVRSDLYSKLENYLYNSLLFIVSSWSLAAGLTVVESGDEFKHLIEEPDKGYPRQVSEKQSSNSLNRGNQTSMKNARGSSSNSNSNKNRNSQNDITNATPEKVPNASLNCGAIEGHANETATVEPLQVKDCSSVDARSRTSGKLKSNGVSLDESAQEEPVGDDDRRSGGDNISTNGKPMNGKQENCPCASERSVLNASENETATNNGMKNDSKMMDTTDKLNGSQVNGVAGANNIVTRDTSLTPTKLINEQYSLKTSQAKPRILLLCNHISTADVPLMMQSFSTLTNQSILWVLDAQFKMTNFGVVCGSHGDFFVDKNSYVDGALREHVLKYPDRNLLVLFPEGGFLRKRIEGSNRYATRNGLPHTKYVTHPRFGAFKDLTDPSVGITHIVDATLIYNNIKDPISILDIAFGNKKEPAILHFKVYNRSEITPNEEWLRNIWLEKDKLLASYYADKANVLGQFADTFRVAILDWFKVLSVHLFYSLVCYLAIFRLFNATSVTMLKARELYYSNI